MIKIAYRDECLKLLGENATHHLLGFWRLKDDWVLFISIIEEDKI